MRNRKLKDNCPENNGWIAIVVLYFFLGLYTGFLIGEKVMQAKALKAGVAHITNGPEFHWIERGP